MGATVGVIGHRYPEDGETRIQDIGTSKAPQSNYLADCWLPTAPRGRLLAADCSTRPTAGCRLLHQADCWLPTAPPGRLLAADCSTRTTAPLGRLLAADCSTKPTAGCRLLHQADCWLPSAPTIRLPEVNCSLTRPRCDGRTQHRSRVTPAIMYSVPCPWALFMK